MGYVVVCCPGRESVECSPVARSLLVCVGIVKPQEISTF